MSQESVEMYRERKSQWYIKDYNSNHRTMHSINVDTTSVKAMYIHCTCGLMICYKYKHICKQNHKYWNSSYHLHFVFNYMYL